MITIIARLVSLLLNFPTNLVLVCESKAINFLHAPVY